MYVCTRTFQIVIRAQCIHGLGWDKPLHVEGKTGQQIPIRENIETIQHFLSKIWLAK